MDIATFVIMLLFLWLVNAVITGALSYIYKDKRRLFLYLAIGYSLLFLSYVFFYFRVSNPIYINGLLGNMFYVIGNILIIKGLYRHLKLKEKIGYIRGFSIVVLLTVLFTIAFQLEDFYYRNIVNALFPMTAYLILIIQESRRDKHFYKKITMITVFIHAFASIYRIIASLHFSSSLDFYALIDFNMFVYAIGQLSLMFLGQFICIAVFYETVKDLDKKNMLLSNSMVELKEVNKKDGLTCIYNRGFGDQVLKILHDQFKKEHIPFSILLADIDNFKSINDQYSHNKGDEVLKWIAKYFISKVRSSDYVIRWGGDEFLIIFVGVNEDKELKLSNQVMKDLSKEAKVELDIEVELSYGFSSIKEDSTVQRLLLEADEKMYKDKRKK